MFFCSLIYGDWRDQNYYGRGKTQTGIRFRTSFVAAGGFEEATVTCRFTERVYLKTRAGFIKYALRHGYDLVPCFTVGDSDMFQSCKEYKVLATGSMIAVYLHVLVCITFAKQTSSYPSFIIIPYLLKSLQASSNFYVETSKVQQSARCLEIPLVVERPLHPSGDPLGLSSAAVTAQAGPSEAGHWTTIAPATN